MQLMAIIAESAWLHLNAMHNLKQHKHAAEGEVRTAHPLRFPCIGG